MMLMDDKEVALNDAIRALREAALRHDDDRGRAENGELQSLLDGLAHRRDAAAETILAAWTDAPPAARSPDPEAVAVKDAFSRVKAAVAGSTDMSLASECLTIETRAFNAVETAREFDHEPAVNEALSDAREDIARAMNKLQPFLPETS